ncbi:MAG: DUF4290 domain-containing protein [Candidatus Shikimatogenerans bostrichidophilus]|nr:MAG: DUF4290 domain-containing protein [Candidatus Shikimatogenerans bostrichidophilus]
MKNNQKKIIIPEYGRNIQKLVEYTLKIDNKKKRKKNYKFILNLMKLINNNNNNNYFLNKNLNFKIKLLYQLYLISNMKIKEFDSLFKKVKINNIKKKKLKYPSKNYIKFKYYGKIIQDIINNYIINIKNKKKKKKILKIIIELMKKKYIKWNNKYNVNNYIIFKDIKIISNNKLDIIKEYKNI